MQRLTEEAQACEKYGLKEIMTNVRSTDSKTSTGTDRRTERKRSFYDNSKRRPGQSLCQPIEASQSTSVKHIVPI